MKRIRKRVGVTPTLFCICMFRYYSVNLECVLKYFCTPGEMLKLLGLLYSIVNSPSVLVSKEIAWLFILAS